MPTATAVFAKTGIDVVVCTYNNAAGVEQVLERLRAQKLTSGFDWAVTVVDNASTDETPEVVQRAAERGDLQIRYVYEARQGLTPARLRGVCETSREWIAFVDDDNLVDPNWLAAVSAAIHHRPRAGAIGGRVRLIWDQPPPQSATHFGFCFGEQDLGDHPRQVDCLVGAGVVLRRQALLDCGWVNGPLLPDRIGKSLISGGDVEIALRVRAAGYELWYEPAAEMLHRMAAARAMRRYLLRINWALGGTSAVVSLLGWPTDYGAWLLCQRRIARRRLGQAWRGLIWSLANRREITGAFGWMSYALGMVQGIDQITRRPPDQRAALLGQAISPPTAQEELRPSLAATASAEFVQ
jgi:glycosyltransferase involved in cell wall biosynthesis